MEVSLVNDMMTPVTLIVVAKCKTEQVSVVLRQLRHPLFISHDT